MINITTSTSRGFENLSDLRLELKIENLNNMKGKIKIIYMSLKKHVVKRIYLKVEMYNYLSRGDRQTKELLNISYSTFSSVVILLCCKSLNKVLTILFHILNVNSLLSVQSTEGAARPRMTFSSGQLSRVRAAPIKIKSRTQFLLISGQE